LTLEDINSDELLKAFCVKHIS